MPNALSRFEDEFWGSWKQTEVFRHTQALAWLNASSGPVLDVGCGDGFFLSLLRKRGIESWGVDISPVAVSNCQSNGLDAIVCDFEAGALPDRFARTCVILDVLEHMYDPKPILQALHEKVETLIISVPNFVSLPARLQVLRGGVPENNTPRKGHIYWYTKKILERRLDESGWKIEAWAFNPPWMSKPVIGPMMKILSKITPALFSLSFLVIAKRKT
ncbi:MAG: class I SAM-dependent methyltransferase [Patescibacteria group bacterium]